MKHFCNPINIPYKFQHYNNQASREAADPTLILYKGKYYLFASMSGGFYYSDDLCDWKWHENRNLDLYRYAPDVRQIGDYLVFCASDRGKPSTFWRTLDPLSDRWEKVSEPFDFWDPNLFQDDDGRVFLYWGCDNGNPIFCQELDPEKLTPVGEKAEVIHENHEYHGWERQIYPGTEKSIPKSFNDKLLAFLMKLSGRGPEKPFIEGAYMNKWNGKYYLQYAAPATESSTYGDGVYVGDSPLGPFTYQTHNPVSSKPGGFITGAGHGSTIEDKYGNLWHAATMRISVNANFERRVGIFPAGLDEDGILFCNQSFGDYPMEIPEGKFDPLSIKPKWMLLSYQKPCKASSCAAGYEPEQAVNEDIRTSWCAKGSSGEWLELDLGDVYTVHAIQINFAEVDIPMLQKDKSERSGFTTSNRYIDTDIKLKTRYILEGSVDGNEWFTIEDKNNANSDLSHDYLCLNGQAIRYLRITAVELPYHSSFALSGLRVFGEGTGNLPGIVKTFRAFRLDPMTLKLTWTPSGDAFGYDIKYGIAPNKLYSSHMVYGKSEVVLTMLNKDQKYYVRIDSFNENGVTEGKTFSVGR